VYKTPFSAVVTKFELEPNTIDFVGHAVALHTNDNFLNRPAIETIDKIKLYMDSIGRYGDSPFIYPVYGLGGDISFILKIYDRYPRRIQSYGCCQWWDIYA
jgi:Rab GDP dissociation inhibitor